MQEHNTAGQLTKHMTKDLLDELFLSQPCSVHTALQIIIRITVRPYEHTTHQCASPGGARDPKHRRL
jgi:hypothetical protein